MFKGHIINYDPLFWEWRIGDATIEIDPNCLIRLSSDHDVR